MCGALGESGLSRLILNQESASSNLARPAKKFFRGPVAQRREHSIVDRENRGFESRRGRSISKRSGPVAKRV